VADRVGNCSFGVTAAAAVREMRALLDRHVRAEL